MVVSRWHGSLRTEKNNAGEFFFVQKLRRYDQNQIKRASKNEFATIQLGRFHQTITP